MRDSAVTEVKLDDEALIQRTRTGDRRAFAELWRRHYRSGLTVARSFTTLDPDDLVSEAFTRIYQRTIDGGGPKGAFRPYLYTTIRNLACTWGTARAKSINVDEFDEFEPAESAEEPVARSLDRTLTVQAYRSLPARWQTVLWYTEVEGLEPSDVAPILGMSANGVAALSYRAREGLRKAWLQAHVSDASATGTCAWVIERVGEHARKALTERETQKLRSHLAVCAKCTIVSQEVDDVGSRLAMAMLPLLVGGVVAGTFVAASATTGTAAVAASAVPALPASIGAASAGAAATGGSAVAGIATIAASTVIVAAAGVGAVGVVQSNQAQAETVAAGTSTSQAGALADPAGIDSATPKDPSAAATAAPLTPVDPAATSLPSDVVSTPVPTTPPVAPPATTDPPATDPKDTTPADTGPTSAPTSASTDTAGKKVKDTVTTTTKAVDTVVTSTTKTVDTVVGATTDVVDKVVDVVVPPGTLNDTLGAVTGGLDTTVGSVTGTADTTVGAVTGLVGGLVGGLIGH